ncbi:uncharacterized protein LOC117114600 [Anneissia japonica]|uniref:uncharacterized protein LOC117114600 n=1 Tax=Anneissia japonica TaxID=1529436 RepID=UPI001425B832|nr:uncharacterized protein LOC117114600 [Anneissia japonica]
MASAFVGDIVSKALAQTQQELVVDDQEIPISDITKDIIHNEAIITPVEALQNSSSVNTTAIQPVDDVKMEAIEVGSPSDGLLEEMASAFVKDILSKALAQTQQELLVADQAPPICDTTIDISQKSVTEAIITPVEDQQVSSPVNTTVIQPVDDVKTEAIEAGIPSDGLLEEMASAFVEDILSNALAQTQQELLVADQAKPISDTTIATEAIITPVEDQLVSSSVNTTVIQPVDDVKTEAIEDGIPSDELLEEMASAFIEDILSNALAQTQHELLVADQATPISDTTIDTIHNEAIITSVEATHDFSSVNTTAIQPVDDVKLEAIEAENPSDELLEEMASAFVMDILSKALAQTQQGLLLCNQETAINDSTIDNIHNEATEDSITSVEAPQDSSSVNTTTIQPVDDVKLEAIEAENPSDELLEEMASAFVKDILSKALAQAQQGLLLGNQETAISDSTIAIITPFKDQQVSSSVNTTVIQPVDDTKMEAIEAENPSDELLEEMASAFVKDILSKALAQAQQGLLLGNQETEISDSTIATEAFITSVEAPQDSYTTAIQPVDDVKLEAIEAENPSDELLEEMASAFVEDILENALAQTQQELHVGDQETLVSDTTIDIIYNDATEAITTPAEAQQISSTVNTTDVPPEDVNNEAIAEGSLSDELIEKMASAFVKDILAKALAQTQLELLDCDQETPISDKTIDIVHNEDTEAILEAPKDSKSVNTTVIQLVDDVKMEAIDDKSPSDELIKEMASAFVEDILSKALAQTQQELLVDDQEIPIRDSTIGKKKSIILINYDNVQ